MQVCSELDLQTVRPSLDWDWNIAAMQYSTLGLQPMPGILVPMQQARVLRAFLCTPCMQAFQGCKVRRRPKLSADDEFLPSWELWFMLKQTDQQDCDSSETWRLIVSSETPGVQLHQLMWIWWMPNKTPNNTILML